MAASSSSSGNPMRYARAEIDAFQMAYEKTKAEGIPAKSIEQLRELRENIRTAFDRAISSLQRSPSTKPEGAGVVVSTGSTENRELIKNIQKARESALETTRKEIEECQRRQGLTGIDDLDQTIFSDYLSWKDVSIAAGINVESNLYKVESFKDRLRSSTKLSLRELYDYAGSLINYTLAQNKAEGNPPPSEEELAAGIEDAFKMLVQEYCQHITDLRCDVYIPAIRDKIGTEKVLEIAIEFMPALTSIDLSGPGSIWAFNFSLFNRLLRTFRTFGQDLRSLNLDHSGMNSKSLLEILTLCPHLTSLNVSRIPMLQRTDFVRSTELTHLYMHQTSSSELEHIIAHFPNLTHFEITGSFVKDEDIVNFGTRCPHLKSLNLSNCPYLTTAGVLAMLAECPELEFLDISNTNIDPAEIIAQRPTLKMKQL